MRNRFEVTLNGEALTSLNDQLYIVDLQYDTAGFSDSAASWANRNGLLVQRRYYQSTSLTVEFELHVYSPLERHQALMKIAEWAMRGGKLKTNDRIGQYLDVICEQPPVMKSAQNWTDTLSMTFVAYNPPYWQEETEDTLTLSSGSSSLYVHGNVETVLDAEVTASASLTTMTLTANGNAITLAGLTVLSGGKVTLSHDANGFLKIYHGSTSILDKRTGVDELVVTGGEQNTLAFSTDGTASCIYKARGRWY